MEEEEYLNSTFNHTTFNQTDCNMQTSHLRSPFFPATMYTIYSIVFTISLIGNGIVCYIVIFSPRMRTVTNYFIMNLAVGDILITLFCIPFTAVSYMWQYWPFSVFLCPVVNYTQAVSVFVSSYTLVAISVDRYVAIMWPLRPRQSKRTASFVILMVWLVAILTVMPTVITSKLRQPTDDYKACDKFLCLEDWDEIGSDYRARYTKALLVLQYVIPVSVLLFTYTSIAVMIWCHRIPGEAENCRDQRIARSKRKMIKMMIIVVIVYTICWLPINILWIVVEHYDIGYTVQMYWFFSSHWFAMSHTCYNPIIYCYMNNRFRSGFFQTFGSVPCLRRCCTPFIFHRSSTSFPLTSKSMRRRDRKYTASSKQHLYNVHQHEAEEWQ